MPAVPGGPPLRGGEVARLGAPTAPSSRPGRWDSGSRRDPGARPLGWRAPRKPRSAAVGAAPPVPGPRPPPLPLSQRLCSSLPKLWWFNALLQRHLPRELAGALCFPFHGRTSQCCSDILALTRRTLSTPLKSPQAKRYGLRAASPTHKPTI